jgi:signal transduction histidine kinase
MAQVYAGLGQYPKAYQTEKEYHQLSDSLYSQGNKNKIAELENREKLVKKDREIAVNKLVIEQKEKQKWYLSGGIFLLLCIGGLLLYQNHIRKKNNQKLQALNAELDQANQVKTRFFSILNHDLRSPVSNLIDFLHLQKDSPDLLDEATKSRIEQTTLASAENLLHSMEDLLLWSKGQMERFEPQLVRFSVDEIFADTQSYFASEKIKIQFKNQHNLEVFTDKDYLKTIIRNLTGNALKALSETSNPSVVWTVFMQDEKVVFSITDNGPGADQSEFKALYDENEIIGVKSGLGLHLIRDLAKAIQAEIKVKSTPNQGTTIDIWI